MKSYNIQQLKKNYSDKLLYKIKHTSNVQLFYIEYEFIEFNRRPERVLTIRNI